MFLSSMLFKKDGKFSNLECHYRILNKMLSLLESIIRLLVC